MRGKQGKKASKAYSIHSRQVWLHVPDASRTECTYSVHKCYTAPTAPACSCGIGYVQPNSVGTCNLKTGTSTRDLPLFFPLFFFFFYFKSAADAVPVWYLIQAEIPPEARS